MKEILRKLANSHKSSKWVFWKVARCKQIIFNQSRKRRLPRNVSAASFFKALNDSDVRYVVLRWYEKLPDVDPDEDIDILIEDADVKIIEKSTVRSARKGKIALDVYSTTGIANYGYRGVAYYPPKIAKIILDSAIIHEDQERRFPTSSTISLV